MFLNKQKSLINSSKNVPLRSIFKARLNEGKQIHFESPNRLCIYDENFSYQTYIFVSYIEELVFEHKIGITIDLSNLEYISAAASLLLFAKVSKCQLCVKQPDSINIVQPRNKDMRALFQISGLWSAIKPGGTSKIERLIESNNLYLSGSNSAYENIQKVLNSTMVNLTEQNVELNKNNKMLFTRGISEAILNVCYHAYSDTALANQFPEISNGRWWQCCWLNKKQQFVFIIFDDGDGIPNSIKKAFEDRENETDDKLIEFAMTKGVSKTQSPERGLGSNDMIQTSCVFPNSHLLIFSGRGYYRYENSKVFTKEMPFELNGTLTEWVLDYKAEE